MKKVKSDEKWQTILFFGFFQKNIEQCRKKRKMMKMGKTLMKKVKIDEE